MKIEDLALQRNKYKHLTDEEWRWFLQQVEGRERTADKLPTFAATDDWWYPVRLSCEQCSSELTASYKASLVESQKSKDKSPVMYGFTENYIKVSCPFDKAKINTFERIIVPHQD